MLLLYRKWSIAYCRLFWLSGRISDGRCQCVCMFQLKFSCCCSYLQLSWPNSRLLFVSNCFGFVFFFTLVRIFLLAHTLWLICDKPTLLFLLPLSFRRSVYVHCIQISIVFLFLRQQINSSNTEIRYTCSFVYSLRSLITCAVSVYYIQKWSLLCIICHRPISIKHTIKRSRVYCFRTSTFLSIPWKNALRMQNVQLFGDCVHFAMGQQTSATSVLFAQR